MVGIGSERPVLLIGPLPPPITGQSAAFSVLAERLAERIQIRVLDLSARQSRRDQAWSLNRAVDLLLLAARLWNLTARARLLYLTIAQSRWGFLRDALMFGIARLRHLPVVAHLHGGNYGEFYAAQPGPMRWLIRRVFSGAQRIIVLDDLFAKDFDFLGPSKRTRVRVVSNPCTLPVTRPRQVPRGELRLLYLSNLVVEKGYMDCVRAMADLRRLLPDVNVRLLMAGQFVLANDTFGSTDEMRAHLQSEIEALDLGGIVELLGVIEGERKRAILSDAHIHLLPTYYENEGQPIALIEALSQGIPSIVTAWRGIPAIVRDNETGLLVPPRDPSAIARAVTRLHEDPGLYEEISRKSVAAAAAFAPDRHVAAIAALFDEVAPPDELPRGAGP